MTIKIAQIVVLLAAATTVDAASPQWYQDVYGTVNFNGQVTLKDANGSSVSAASNPTGGNVTATQASSVQPPVVVVQATATLPIHAIGDACTASTTGIAPNQIDGEGISITLDRTSLLTCQSGVWAKQSANGVSLSSSWNTLFNGHCTANLCYSATANGFVVNIATFSAYPLPDVNPASFSFPVSTTIVCNSSYCSYFGSSGMMGSGFVYPSSYVYLQPTTSGIIGYYFNANQGVVMNFAQAWTS